MSQIMEEGGEGRNKQYTPGKIQLSISTKH